MNFLDLNKDNKFDTKDGQIILAYTFAAVGIFLLVAAFFFPPLTTFNSLVHLPSAALSFLLQCNIPQTTRNTLTRQIKRYILARNKKKKQTR